MVPSVPPVQCGPLTRDMGGCPKTVFWETWVFGLVGVTARGGKRREEYEEFGPKATTRSNVVKVECARERKKKRETETETETERERERERDSQGKIYTTHSGKILSGGEWCHIVASLGSMVLVPCNK